jgi:hypothetical protein
MSLVEYVHKQGFLMKTGHYNHPSTSTDVNSNILDEATRAAQAAKLQLANTQPILHISHQLT